MLMGGWGMQRQRHGEQNPLDVSNASLYVRTNWHLPGGGFGLLSLFKWWSANSNRRYYWLYYRKSIRQSRCKTWLDDTSKSAFPLARISDVLLHPGKKFTITVLKLLTRTLKRYIGRAVIHLFTIKIPIP